LGCAILAYVLATSAASLILKHREDLSQRQRTARLLEEMGTLRIGQPFPNDTIERLTGVSVPIRDLVSEHSVIMFVNQDCGVCEAQIADIWHELAAGRLSFNPIFVADYFPFEAGALSEVALERHFAYDRGSVLRTRLGVRSVPFNVFLGSDLIVDSVLVGRISLSSMSASSSTAVR